MVLSQGTQFMYIPITPHLEIVGFQGRLESVASLCFSCLDLGTTAGLQSVSSQVPNVIAVRPTPWSHLQFGGVSSVVVVSAVVTGSSPLTLLIAGSLIVRHQTTVLRDKNVNVLLHSYSAPL